MRILTLIHEFPPIGGGGGRAAFDICRELVKRGHDVTVLTAHMNGLPYDEIRDGIRLVRISSYRTEPFSASFSTMLSYILLGFWTGLILIVRFRPNIIHSHFAVPAGALAFALSILTGVPYILTAHLGDVPGGVPEKTERWFRWLEPYTKPIWKCAKHIVAVSEFTRQLALKHYSVNIRVIPNGVDFTNLLPKHIEINKAPHIVFAGRFVSQKNPLVIIHVLSMLKDLDWTCSMIGNGPMFNDVQEQIQKYELENRFYLPGWVTSDDVLNQFSKSDILFMPSLSEGLPVVGVQALANGLAFVVSDIGGFADLVDNEKNGFLIAVENTDVFATALRNLISDPDLLMKFRKASLLKAKQFDIVHVVNEYEKLLK